MSNLQDNVILGWVRRHKILSSVLGILAILVIVLLVMAFIPFSVRSVPAPQPAASYEEALSRLDTIANEQAANPDINPVCYTSTLTHDEKTENVIVLFHGFTSCPKQMAVLGEQLYDQG